MRLAIVGSRDLPCVEKNPYSGEFKLVNSFVLHKIILALPHVISPSMIAVIVSGGAKGADTVAEYLAYSMNIPPNIHHADWNRYGNSAGPKRNGLIEKDADACFAIVNKRLSFSKGTSHTVSLFQRSDKPVFLLEFDEVGEHMINATWI